LEYLSNWVVAGIDDVIGLGSHHAYASGIKKCCGMVRYRGFVTHLAEMSLPTVSGLAY
jgi:hypothetical protein